VRRTPLIALAMALLVAVAGCVSAGSPPDNPTPSAAVPSGATEHRIAVASGERSYRLYRPAAAPGPSGYPLVVMLHGGLGSAVQAERSYGWDDLAASERFVVAYPDGLERSWNAGSCCGIPAKKDVDDVGFISAVVSDVARTVAVDPARSYVTGMSNGAMMAYRLACETTLFAAVAPVAGDEMVSCADPAPASLLHVHGTADTKVPLDGSPGSGIGKVDGPPIAQVVDSWRETDGCGAFTTTTKESVTTRTASCPSGRTVELVLVAGAGHQWPGSTAATYPGADKPSQAFSATRLIWTFFAAHPKP